MFIKSSTEQYTILIRSKLRNININRYLMHKSFTTLKSSLNRICFLVHLIVSIYSHFNILHMLDQATELRYDKP